MSPPNDTTYRGSCHCGRYRFELTLPEAITTAIQCTCTLCVKKGHLWITPPATGFQVIRDDGRLRDYASNALQDKFCTACGTSVTGKHTSGPLQGQFAVNARTLHGINPFQLEPNLTIVETSDERQIQKPATSAPALHLFSCHCGKLQAELLVDIRKQELKEDNCSSCVRNAYIGVYPDKDNVRIHGRQDALELYGFRAEKTGRRWGSGLYCATCGVYIANILYGPPLSMYDKLPPERKAMALEMHHKNTRLLPLNARALEGLDGILGELKIERTDEGTEGYAEELEPWRGDG